MVDFESNSGFIFGGIANVSRAFDTIALLAGALSIEWVSLWFLYKNKSF